MLLDLGVGVLGLWLSAGASRDPSEGHKGSPCKGKIKEIISDSLKEEYLGEYYRVYLRGILGA